MQVNGTNAPNTFSETDTLTAGTTVMDGGLLSLNLPLAAAAGGGQWAVFDFRTTSGGIIAGNPVANWGMAVDNIPLLLPAELTHFYLDWGTNGTLANPTSQDRGNLPLETNPITGSGTVFGENFAIPVTTIVNFNGFADTFDSFLNRRVCCCCSAASG